MAGGFELVPLDEADHSGGSWELAPIETERPSVLRNVALNNPLTAIAETGANLLSQGVALPAAGLAGIGAVAGKAMGLTDADPAEVVHKVGGALTYQPRGEMGQAATEAVMYPFQKLAEVGQGAGDWVLEKTGSPIAATAVDTAINAAPMAVVPGWKAGKSATARGLLNHHQTPGPEVLQRLMRISPEEAAMYFNDWSARNGAQAGGSNGPSMVRNGGDVQRVAPNPIPMSESAGSGLEALRRPGRDDLPGMADQLPDVPAGGWTEAGTGSAALAGTERLAGELRAGERGLAETPAPDFAPEILSPDQLGRGNPDHRGSRPADRYAANDVAASLADAEARSGASGDAGVAAVSERFQATDLQRPNAELAGMGAGVGYPSADLAQPNRPRRSAATDTWIAQDRQAAAQDPIARADRILTERGSIAGWIDHYNKNVRDGSTVESFQRNQDGSHTLRVSNGQTARTVTVPADKLPEYLNVLRDPAKVAEIEARNQGDVVLGRRVREMDDATLAGWRGMVSLSDAARTKLEREAKRREVDAAAHQAATSPLNDRPQPTVAQIEAGTYAKGHLDLHGLPIAIENPKGSIRRGTDASGRTWETEMQHHYGYIKRSTARDGDHVDAFIGERPESTRAFVIDQINPKTGRYDEAKVILGALDEADARRIYHANYEPGWKGLGAITPMEMDAFKGWVNSEASKRPAGLPRVAGKAVTEFDDAALSRLATAPTLSESARAKVAAELERRTASADSSADGVQGMAAGVQNSWAPGQNYVPLRDSINAAASETAAVKAAKPIRREDVLRPFLKALDINVYHGRVKGNRLGYYIPKKETLRVKNKSDLEVTAHEVFHALDDRIPEIRAAWRNDKELREQLKAVSYDKSNIAEGYAEAGRLWLTNPEALEAAAPKAYGWLETFADTHPLGPALRDAQRGMVSWYEQSALDRARSKIGDPTSLNNRGLVPFLFDKWEAMHKGFRQSVVDDLDGIRLSEMNLTGKLSPLGAYETARLTRAAASITDGAVRFGHPVKRAEGSFTYSGKSLEEILSPVAGDLDNFMAYAVGRSARELMAQGRENLFTPAEIRAAVALETPEFRTAFAGYQTWNKGVLDFAESFGILNPETRKLWKRQEYLPFWRVGQGVSGEGAVSGQWAGVKGLKGGTGNLRAPLENMTMNANALITAALKNDARARVVEMIEAEQGGGKFMQKIPAEARPVKIDAKQVQEAVLKDMGIGDRASLSAEGVKFAEHVEKQIAEAPEFYQFFVGGQAPKGSNIVAVMKAGKPEYFEVADPLLLRALTALDRPAQSWIIKLLGFPKRLGQASIVLDPTFMAANFARDQISAGVMTRSGYRPLIDAMDGMRRRMTNDPLYREWVANGGAMSSLFLDESAFRSKLEQFYTKQGIDYKTVIDSPKKLLNMVETFGEAFESATRIGEMKRALAKGDHPRHAAYKSREVSVDFSQAGDAPAVRALYDTVIFLRAAVVSWDRLYRGVRHDPNNGLIAARAASIGLASAALYLMNRGDPRYDDMSDYLKDSHWHVFLGEHHFMIPKAFEWGAIGSIAERSIEKVMDEDPEGLAGDVGRIAKNNFRLNMMPQIVAPLVEQYANKNSFTTAPIETPGMENVQPFLRAKPGTSETMRAAGMATKDLPESLQINPVRAEALLRDYANSWAAYALLASDKIFFGDKLPEMRADEMPVVKRFYQSEPPKHTKFETSFYEMLSEAKRLRGTMKELDEMGLRSFADVKEQSPLATEAKPLERAQKSLAGINNDMEAVRRDQTTTPAEKRQKLDALTVERNALLKDAVQASKAAQQEKAK